MKKDDSDFGIRARGYKFLADLGNGRKIYVDENLGILRMFFQGNDFDIVESDVNKILQDPKIPGYFKKNFIPLQIKY